MSNFWPVKVLRFVTIFFLLSVALGMWLYPGGNIHDPQQLGYSFTHNFLSDLGGYQSHSDEVNFLSSFFFNMGMFLFIAVGIGFVFIRGLFSEDKLSNVLATLGSLFFFIGTLFFAGVGLTPYDLYLDLHVFFAVNAFRLLVPGALFYVLVLFRSEVSNRFSFVTMFYLLSIVAYVVYQLRAGNPFDSPEEMIRQATIQKLIVIASVASIFSLSFAFQKQIDVLNASDEEGE
jgi:hypothetical membrane protein